MGNAIFLRVIKLLYACTQNDRYRVWYSKTRKPECAIYVFSCTDCVLLNNFFIDFLQKKIGTFKEIRANEVYVHVRVVLTRIDLYYHTFATVFLFLKSDKY